MAALALAGTASCTATGARRGPSIKASGATRRRPDRAGGRPAPSALAGPLTHPVRADTSVGGARLRPPAVPLVVRDPYVSAWLCGTELAGTWATGWDGGRQAVCGLARIDEKPYLWCGAPDVPGVELAVMTQRSLEVTPTRSIFTLEGGGVELVAEWLSPVEPGDPKRQSVPLGLLTVSVSSSDGRPHAVELYVDVSGEWATGLEGDTVVWQTSLTRSRHWTVQVAPEQPLGERGEMAAWGTAVFSTAPVGRAASFQSGADAQVRALFASSGRLGDGDDPSFRPVDADTPVFALAHDLGSVRGPLTAHWCFGHFESPAVQYLGQPLEPLWTAYWPSWQAAVDDFLSSANETRLRAAALDDRITSTATAAGGPAYSGLCALALRQAYGACQLVAGPGGRPWAFLKELSSDDDVSTVDVVFDSCPVWLALDPGFLAMLLEPILHYAASGRWSEGFAPHSLGFWPLADGNPLGPAFEKMPVQDSGALLVMAAAYASRVPEAAARSFLAPHEALFGAWAELVASELPAPPAQLTTIDYLGPSPANTNLAALGVVGLGAFAQILERLGHGSEARSWRSRAERLGREWAARAMDPAGRHLDRNIGNHGTWSNLCNAFWDRALVTKLLPAKVSSLQATWYRARFEPYGLAVEDKTPSLARLDQELLTAAWLREFPVRDELVERVARYLGHTAFRAPMPDTYDPRTGSFRDQYNWRARPVVGAAFGLLLVS